jgi:catalase
MEKIEPVRASLESIARKSPITLRFVGLAVALLAVPAVPWATPQSRNDLSHQIFETMLKVQGTKPGFRPVHANGIVCQGSFIATPAAATLSVAGHLQGAKVPVAVRFSDGAPDPSIPDNSPNASPRGMAIRFKPPGGAETDIVSISHNGFIVGSGEEFLALQQAIVATEPSKPHPWPVEQFLGAHPRALKFVQDGKAMPDSFATESFFGNSAFVFVNKAGAKQAFRYQILPVAGAHNLSDADLATRSPDYLFAELKTRLAKGPVKFRLVAQLPGPEDSTDDSSIVWPADRKTVELGTITITTVVADNDTAQKALAFTPILLTTGIELSDDPLPALRGDVYALSAAHRMTVK